MTGSGDFGRRINHLRDRLELTLEQAAERADMSAGYIQWLETQRGAPDRGTATRLAGALRTTVDDLLGDDGSPGQVQSMDEAVPEVLEPEECLRLVAPGGIGRVAFNGSRGQTVLPVNFTLHDGAVVFRTARGGPMDADLRTGLEGVDIKIAFQVDRIDEARRAGWSVLIQGAVHHVPDDEVAKVSDAGVTPWAGGERHLYVRIMPQQVTGRRIHGL